MQQHDNDDDKLPFITIGAATQNVMRFLLREAHKETEKDRTHESERDRQNEQKDEAHRDYLAERLREIERFERRAAGLIPHRSRREGK